jgi:hypothetical protein
VGGPERARDGARGRWAMRAGRVRQHGRLGAGASTGAGGPRCGRAEVWALRGCEPVRVAAAQAGRAGCRPAARLRFQAGEPEASGCWWRAARCARGQARK